MFAIKINVNIKLFFISLIAFMLLLNKQLLSQDIPIIVIAPSKKAQSVSTVGSSVSVFDENYIENTNDFFLGDVLDNGTPSYNFFQSGGHGTESGIQLRGMPKRYSTVYIDGVKMSDPSSVSNDYNFNHILKNQLSRVEILRGSQSSVYGSGAIGGTVNIQTKRGQPGFQKNLIYNTGSNALHDLALSFSGANEKHDFYVGLERFQTEGISAMDDNSEKDEYRNNTIVANYGYELSDEIKFKTNYRLADTYLQYDTVDETYTDNNYSDAIESSASVSLEYIPNKKFSNRFTMAKTYIERIYNEYNHDQDEYAGDRNALSYSGIYNINLDNSVIFGADFELDEMALKKDSTDSKHNNKVFSRYLDIQSRITNNLYATLGARFDEHSIVGNEDSERLTLAYLFDDKTMKIKSSYGTGFRFPSIYGLHYVYGANSETAKAEKSESFDIGFEKSFIPLNLDIDLSYFNLEYVDSLEGWETNVASGSAYTWQNSPSVVKSHGLEFISKWKVNKFLNFDLNYTYTSTYDGGEQDDPNKSSSYTIDQLVRVPKHFLNLSTKIPFPGKNFDLVLNTKWSDEMRDYGNANIPSNGSYDDVRLDDFLIHDLSFNYNLFNNYKFYVDIKNILDSHYNTALQYSQMDRSLNFGIKRLY